MYKKKTTDDVYAITLTNTTYNNIIKHNTLNSANLQGDAAVGADNLNNTIEFNTQRENLQTNTNIILENSTIHAKVNDTITITAKVTDIKNNLLSVLSAALRMRKSTPALNSCNSRTLAAAKPAEPIKRLKPTGINKLVALACSTGGPKALQSVIPYLPKNLNAPIVLVQHMPAGFTASLAARLNEMSDINV